MAKKFYKDGLKFSCQGSGKCCRSDKKEGYLYLTLDDRRQMAKELSLTTSQFTRQYTAIYRGQRHLKQLRLQCMFLEKKKCKIYKSRPLQCRSWPFWSENMNEKTWEKAKKLCAGMGKGKHYSAEEIEAFIWENENISGL
jgi:uncharacterized protein